MGKQVIVKVPATTANLGPGFVVLGMALNLYNTVVLEEMDGDCQLIEVKGREAFPGTTAILLLVLPPPFVQRVTVIMDINSIWKTRYLS